MFQQITMIDYYSCPLSARREERKLCGPYRWTPSEPTKGRGFYQSRHGLKVDRHGSTFDLRLEDANNHLGHNRLSRTLGYCCDDFGDTTLKPIIARLPHGRGFLAGWTMGNGMLGSVGADIYEDERSAAYAAHSMAEFDASEERSRQGEDTEEPDED